MQTRVEDRKKWRPPSTGRLRTLGRELGRRLTSPLGTSCLAALSLWVGMQLASVAPVPGSGLGDLQERLRAQAEQLHDLRAELTLRQIEMERLQRIQEYSTRHGIEAGLAASIYDIAQAEGVSPRIAFRLVETESSFRQMAVSPAGAVGYTQIKPSTAVLLDPSVTRENLFETETNLRLGFRYFALLLERYDDTRLALLAYNRGPTRVGALLALGQDPSNGYASRILTARD